MRFVGLLVFLFFLISSARSQVLINEVMSANVNGILDEDKEFPDWIELFNAGNAGVNLTGYSLTDDNAFPGKWIFPVMTLPAKQHLLIFASGKDRKQAIMNFETIIDIGDTWKYLIPDSDIGSDWQNTGFNDSAWAVGKSSFGYSDNDDTTIIQNTANCLFIRKEFYVSDLASLSRLVLSIDYDDGFVAYINGHEVARSNIGNAGEYTPFSQFAVSSREALMWQGGAPEYYDISNISEILNEGSNIIAIQVHNNVPGSSDLSLIPFLTTGRFSGPQDVSPWLSFSFGGGLHTNFKLDADSDAVFLFNASGVLVDSITVMNMMRDVSFGRKPDGGPLWKYFGFSRPGNINSGDGCNRIIADSVIFSSEGGKVPVGYMVTLSGKQSLDSIYYTTDGSIPDAVNATLYTDPLQISNSLVIRARIIKHNTLPGPVISRTFVTGRNHDIPIICLTTNPGNLWNDDYGIYAFGSQPLGEYPYFNANFWKDWERPVHMELYDVKGIRQVDQDLGTKIFGAWSRASDQKSMALYARKSYGKGSLQYKFFADKPIDKFESLVLRNSGNDNMGLQFHDCFMTGLTREMDIDRQAYQPAAIYLNGQYWGLLNIREKVSNNYLAENHQVDADSVILLEGWGGIIDGNNQEYLELVNFLNLKSTLQNEADYNTVRNKIDLDNYIQYQLTEIYLNNRDWPGNNIKFWKTTAADSKWRWIIYDTDFGFGIWNTNDYEQNSMTFALEANGPDWPNPPWSTLLFRRLVTNLNFRNNFIIQYCDRLNQDFHPDRVFADLDSIQQLYDNEIVYNFARWWGSYDEWLWRISNRKIFGENRPSYCRTHLQQQFGLSSQLNVSINVSDADAGYVKLNTIYPKKFPFNGIYFRNIPITMTAIPKPGYRFVKWEGSVNSNDAVITYNMSGAGSFIAVFASATQEEVKVIINEINYKSSDARDTKDWVELYNNGTSTADLSGWVLTDDGVDSSYVFPEGTWLTPGSYLVVCRNTGDFKTFNPSVTSTIGNMPFGLSAQGDIVRLYDKHNNLIDVVNYGVVSPWPDNANGTGMTLELKNPEHDNSVPENWQAVAFGGTPGKVNSASTNTENNEKPVDEFGCYPNPFKDFTTIRFTVTEPGSYRLEVLDMNGRTVKILSDRYTDAGSYWIDWTGDTVQGGVYTIRLTGKNIVETRKVVYLK